MDKMQAYQSFWSGFDLKAYDETSVPDDAVMPYITYEASEDDFDHTLALTASVWYRSTSWTGITDKVKQIEERISRGGKIITYTGGAFWISKASPWAQRMPDDTDDSVRRIVLNIQVEFVD